jgi:two-component system nitrogen regulation response regulator GlnG
MEDPDHTITSPLQDRFQHTQILALTVLWHPDRSRIGEQHFEGRPDAAIEVSRYLPMFSHAGSSGLPLGYGGLSRSPVRISQEADGRISVIPPQTRMAIEINGVAIGEAIKLDRAQLMSGVVLALGRAILICIHLTDCLPQENAIRGMIGVSSAMTRVRTAIQSIAATNTPVLLLGETGVGKEVAAQAIHLLSRQKESPMVAVNMAAMNESLAGAELFGYEKGAYTGAQQARDGYFGEANYSTLFLDEIGNTPASVQPMLLRVLESGEYRTIGGRSSKFSNARVIAATDQDLHNAEFNQALLRRLEGFVIHLPPLRERREDIGVLILHFLENIRGNSGAPTELPFDFVSDCVNYAWPGNVRQLAHILNRAVLALHAGQNPRLVDFVQFRKELEVESKSESEPEQGPQARNMPTTRRKSIQDLTDEDVIAALHRNEWEIKASALDLGISRPTMYKLIDAHPAIRHPQEINIEDIKRSLQESGGEIGRCAALLLTPAEALRRYLHVLGLAAGNSLEKE